MFLFVFLYIRVHLDGQFLQKLIGASVIKLKIYFEFVHQKEKCGGRLKLIVDKTVCSIAFFFTFPEKNAE